MSTPAAATATPPAPDPAARYAALEVAPGPHLSDPRLTTRRMMLDVLLALALPVLAGLLVFHEKTLWQLVTSVAGCLAGEAAFMAMRGRRCPLADGSALVTGVILGLSLPPVAPWYVGFIGGLTAMGFGKVVYGGLGHNIFNPAMVGRAFVMIAFPALMGASAYVTAQADVDVITKATPMTAYKMSHVITALGALLMGNTNGSCGETSALACVVGGLYLCLRRTASWQIPAGVLLAVLAIAGVIDLVDTQAWSTLHELAGGALLFGAFYIATDPVTSPVTPRGKWIFGLGVGVLVMVIRKLSGYPEGVMFAVLIMNGLVPLINRATIPVPVGGPVPRKKA